MMSDERLNELLENWHRHGIPYLNTAIELINEIRRLRSELARYKTQNVNEIEVK